MKKVLVTICVIVLLLVVSSYLLNELSKSRNFQLFGDLITNVETNEKVVALTFDDGPGINTDEILAILQEQDVKVTFYLTGHEIENHFEDAQKIVGAGHEVGNHSYSHSRMIFKSPSFIREELEKTNEWIRQAGYEGEITFRPPYGRKLAILPYYLNKYNMKSILWNLEPETYPEIASDAEKIVDYVNENVTPGSIILMHVMYESRQVSLDSIGEMITTLREQGYEFVTVSELLQYEGK